MKSLLVADNRADLLDTIEPILKHWGYRVLAARNPEQFNAFLKESEPSLIIVGAIILSDPALAITPDTGQKILNWDIPLIMLEQAEAGELPVKPHEILSVPLDIFALYAFIQKHLEKHPRHNLRLRVRLPGMYKSGLEYILAEVLSLSKQGLFIKTASPIKENAELSVVFPLLGHKKELELTGKVLYCVLPEQFNNFMQGVGVSFEEISEEEQKSLHRFIEECFLNEVSATQQGVGDFALGQLKARD